MVWAKPVVSFFLTLLTVILLSTHWGNVPPMFYILNPFSGLWVNGDKPLNDKRLAFSELLGPTQVAYDRQLIPHIYAGNEFDAYFAQGFVTARDRLFQMEIQSRVAEGTLAEIFGKVALESDRFMLRSGLNDAAIANFEIMISNPLTRQAIEAYTAGVNRYIDTLRFKDFPAEYKILNIKPRRWRPQYAAYIIKLMEFQLSSRSTDLRMSRTLARFGRVLTAELFPRLPHNNEPLIPKGTTWNHLPQEKRDIWSESPLTLEELPTLPEADENSGSNNWAVGPQKSATGLPIIANDTHLSYRLPNLWYENQISYGKNSVYGVSIPGAPGVIIGFNKNIAWAVTNGYTDIMDWYRIEFKDANKREYRYGEEWKKVSYREYKIKVRDGDEITERVAVTLHGPIVHELKQKPFKNDYGLGLALKWGTVHNGNELNSFLLLATARNYYEARMALQSFHSPPQNFLIADNSGRIGIIHKGLIPKRKTDQGRYVMNGKNPENIWQEFYSSDQVPQVSNPPQGFLFSANQAPVDQNYPYYLGTEWDSPYRAIRIAQMLRQKDKWAPLDFVRMHNDDTSALAADILPTLIGAVNTNELDAHEKGVYRVLSHWRYRYQTESVMPVVLDTWVERLSKLLWEPRFENPKFYRWPPITSFVNILKNQPKSFWFDNPKTKETETFQMLATLSYKQAIAELIAKFGDDVKNWKWGQIQPTEFPHITKVPGFDRKFTDVGGSKYSIFANRGDHGPVLRMVVALGPMPQAWLVVPGGPSGNPFSRQYSNWLEIWRKGYTKAVNFWPTLETIKDTRYRLSLEKDNG